jgi:hypothetical protein
LVASSLSLSLSTDQVEHAALLGSLAAAIQVSRLGNLPIGQAALMRRLNRPASDNQPI